MNFANYDVEMEVGYQRRHCFKQIS